MCLSSSLLFALEGRISIRASTALSFVDVLWYLSSVCSISHTILFTIHICSAVGQTQHRMTVLTRIAFPRTVHPVAFDISFTIYLSSKTDLSKVWHPPLHFYSKNYSLPHMSWTPKQHHAYWLSPVCQIDQTFAERPPFLLIFTKTHLQSAYSNTQSWQTTVLTRHPSLASKPFPRSRATRLRRTLIRFPHFSQILDFKLSSTAYTTIPLEGHPFIFRTFQTVANIFSVSGVNNTWKRFSMHAWPVIRSLSPTWG